MGNPTPFEQALKAGTPEAALALLQADVRTQPGKAELRVALFQLHCILGRWDKALSQLDVAGQLDAGALAMVQTYREAIACERLRSEVFAGRRVPMIFGEPEPWLAMLVEALLQDGRGEAALAASLRAQAFEAAPANAGQMDGRAFDWLADADGRLGPVLEAIVNGRYYWVPFAHLSAVSIEAPADLRDLVWAPAQLSFTNGGEVVALLPNRYPDLPADADGALLMARRTEWLPGVGDSYRGVGQRILVTPDAETALLEIRELRFDAQDAAEEAEAASAPAADT